MQTNRIDLVKGCCQRFQGARAEAAAAAAGRMSEFDALLEATCRVDKDDDSRWGQLCKLANSAAARANEEVARLAAEFGTSVHPQTGPWLEVSYGDLPYLNKRHFLKDRDAAMRKIRRIETEAAEQIERTSMDTLIQLMDEHLVPAEATALVQAIPAAAELVPELKREDLKWEPEAKEAPVFDDHVPF